MTLGDSSATTGSPTRARVPFAKRAQVRSTRFDEMSVWSQFRDHARHALATFARGLSRTASESASSCTDRLSQPADRRGVEIREPTYRTHGNPRPAYGLAAMAECRLPESIVRHSSVREAFQQGVRADQ